MRQRMSSRQTESSDCRDPSGIGSARRTVPQRSGGSRLRMAALILLSASTAGCYRSDPVVPGECADAWADAAAFQRGLEEATVSLEPVWGEYRLADGAYVVHAGDTNDGRACLGIIRGGKTTAYWISDTAPTLSTPLYGYHFPWTGNGGPFDGLVESTRQPASIREWLTENEVPSAVIAPFDIEGFPFEIPLDMRVQVIVHEAFHVHVQSPRWLGTDGDWPAWDLQPDRKSVRTCYDADSTVTSLFEDERRALDSLVVGLLDGNRRVACAGADRFLATRQERYVLLDSVAVPDHEGEPLTCRTAETLMELEEGTADYASWSRLFHDGFFERDALLKRYRAIQAEPFYFTGAMQLHAIYLVDPDAFGEAVHEIVQSLDPETGAITRILEERVAAFCE